jgi:hypothetical protein
MMHAEIRYLHSPDVEDLKSFQPEMPDTFCILVQAMIGPSGLPGEESFDFLVCTPKWLAKELETTGRIWGRHYLFVKRYSFDLLWRTINDLCVNTRGNSWQEIGAQLARYGKWEFEDYRPYEKGSE